MRDKKIQKFIDELDRLSFESRRVDQLDKLLFIIFREAKESIKDFINKNETNPSFIYISKRDLRLIERIEKMKSKNCSIDMLSNLESKTGYCSLYGFQIKEAKEETVNILCI